MEIESTHPPPNLPLPSRAVIPPFQGHGMVTVERWNGERGGVKKVPPEREREWTRGEKRGPHDDREGIVFGRVTVKVLP
jgi:hypothetical protein